MPQKIKIVSLEKNNPFTFYYIKEFISTTFDIGTIKNPQDLDPTTDILNWCIPWKITDDIKKFLDLGGKCIVNNLWEQSVNQELLSFISQYNNNVIIVSCGKINYPSTIIIPDWFWYNESLCYQDPQNNYHHYIPKNNKLKKFLMPMRRKKQHRNYLYNKIQSELDNAIWSYVELGTTLPGNDKHFFAYDRYVDYTWYDNTYFSVVAETGVFGDPFVTEKTFKPIAFYHPFVIVGQTGMLKALHNLGFVTFPELFDESYDTEPDTNLRIDMVVEQVKSFDSTAMLQPIIQEKLNHNYNLFFNKELVLDRINTKLINPLCDFLSK